MKATKLLALLAISICFFSCHPHEEETTFSNTSDYFVEIHEDGAKLAFLQPGEKASIGFPESTFTSSYEFCLYTLPNGEIPYQSFVYDWNLGDGAPHKVTIYNNKVTLQ